MCILVVTAKLDHAVADALEHGNKSLSAWASAFLKQYVANKKDVRVRRAFMADEWPQLIDRLCEIGEHIGERSGLKGLVGGWIYLLDRSELEEYVGPEMMEAAVPPKKKSFGKAYDKMAAGFGPIVEDLWETMKTDWQWKIHTLLRFGQLREYLAWIQARVDEDIRRRVEDGETEYMAQDLAKIAFLVDTGVWPRNTKRLCILGVLKPGFAVAPQNAHMSVETWARKALPATIGVGENEALVTDAFIVSNNYGKLIDTLIAKHYHPIG